MNLTRAVRPSSGYLAPGYGGRQHALPSLTHSAYKELQQRPSNPPKGNLLQLLPVIMWPQSQINNDH